MRLANDASTRSAAERPPRGRRLFRERIESLLDAIESFISDNAHAAAVT